MHVMVCGWGQQALFEMWADFYRTSAAQNFLLLLGVGERFANSEAVCDVGLVLRSAYEIL
jgi:hypothetical protein